MGILPVCKRYLPVYFKEYGIFATPYTSPTLGVGGYLLWATHLDAMGNYYMRLS